MTYEYEGAVINEIKNIEDEYKLDYKSEIKEVREVYRKAKILDEVKNFTTERLKEQKLTDEYDFGERLICEEIEDIIGGRIND